MKKIISLVLFLLIAQTSWANDWFPQVPDQSKPEVAEMTNTIKKYKEELLFSGTGLTFSAQTGQPYNGGMFFFTNQDTGSWTLLQAFGDGMACMIMNGKNFRPYTGEQPYGVKK